MNLAVPMGIDSEPAVSEPLGGLLALLSGLFEDDLRAVYVGHGLLSYASILSTPFCYLPHDAVIPGAIEAGDLQELAAAYCPNPLRMEGLVNGQNVRVEANEARVGYQHALEAYRDLASQFVLKAEVSETDVLTSWILNSFE